MSIKYWIKRSFFLPQLFDELENKMKESDEKNIKLIQEICTVNNSIEELRKWAVALFHEKHEMILADRREMLWLLRTDILEYYSNRETTNEENKVLDWLRENPVQMYPYEFTKKYVNHIADIFDDSVGHHFIIHKGKKLFFPDSFLLSQINDYYYFLLMEQDLNSPHAYFNENFVINKEATFVDVGAAEGLITLEYMDCVPRGIVIEYDTEWLNALNNTFQLYKNKISIIPKLCSNDSGIGKIMLKDVLEDGGIYTIKIDVEGMEMEVLEGLKGVCLKAGSQLLICAYHTQVAEKEICTFLDFNNISYSHSDGFILSTWGGYREPYLRHGLIRAQIMKDTVIK